MGDSQTICLEHGKKLPGYSGMGSWEGSPQTQGKSPPTLKNCCFPHTCPLKTIKFHKSHISPGDGAGLAPPGCVQSPVFPVCHQFGGGTSRGGGLDPSSAAPVRTAAPPAPAPGKERKVRKGKGKKGEKIRKKRGKNKGKKGEGMGNVKRERGEREGKGRKRGKGKRG